VSSGAIVSAAYTIDEDESFAKYAFLDHFSARALINNIVYSGFNGVSAPAVGSEVRLGFGAGFTASLPVGDTARVGFLFDFISNPGLARTIASGLSFIARHVLAAVGVPGRLLQDLRLDERLDRAARRRGELGPVPHPRAHGQHRIPAPQLHRRQQRQRQRHRPRGRRRL